MTREGSVVRMDAVDSIALPGGTPLTLKMGPGQHFLMLKQIGTDLKVGAVVPMIAIVEQATNGAKHRFASTPRSCRLVVIVRQLKRMESTELVSPRKRDRSVARPC